MVKNYLKNGQEADIAGHIVKKDDVPSIYVLIEHLQNGGVKNDKKRCRF